MDVIDESIRKRSYITPPRDAAQDFVFIKGRVSFPVPAGHDLAVLRGHITTSSDVTVSPRALEKRAWNLGLRVSEASAMTFLLTPCLFVSDPLLKKLWETDQFTPLRAAEARHEAGKRFWGMHHPGYLPPPLAPLWERLLTNSETPLDFGGQTSEVISEDWDLLSPGSRPVTLGKESWHVFPLATAGAVASLRRMPLFVCWDIYLPIVVSI